MTIFLVLIALILSILGPHLFNSLLSLIVLYIIIKLFYKKDFPAIVLGAIIFQWLQINIKVWYGNIAGLEIADIWAYHIDPLFIHEANMLSNIGLMFFAYGLYIPYKKVVKQFNIENFKQQLNGISTQSFIVTYLLISFGLEFLYGLRFFFPGINTPIVAAANLKWGLFLIMIFLVYHKKEKIKIVYAIIIIELVLSFASYFSSFKNFIIFYVIAILFYFSFISTQKKFVILSIVGSLALFIGVMWTAIKGDYRFYLSGGIDQQVVVVEKNEALGTFFDLAFSVSKEAMEESIDYLIDRVSYIEFFSITLGYVPAIQDHEKGEITKNALLHIFMPRLFFPNKPVVDDSAHTNKYTGLYLRDEGVASFGIGYMTDFFIDFGEVFMHVAIFFFGFLLGYLLQRIFHFAKNLVWSIIYITPFFFFLSGFSRNLLKVVSDTFVYVLLILFIGNLLYKYVQPYLIKKSNQKKNSPPQSPVTTSI